jgi:hypothetical protein
MHQQRGRNLAEQLLRPPSSEAVGVSEDKELYSSESGQSLVSRKSRRLSLLSESKIQLGRGPSAAKAGQGSVADSRAKALLHPWSCTDPRCKENRHLVRWRVPFLTIFRSFGGWSTYHVFRSCLAGCLAGGGWIFQRSISAQIQNHLRHCESQRRRLPSRTRVRMLHSLMHAASQIPNSEQNRIPRIFSRLTRFPNWSGAPVCKLMHILGAATPVSRLRFGGRRIGRRPGRP